MKRRSQILVIVLVFLFLIAAALVSLVWMEFGRPPDIRAHAVLDISLQGEIQERLYPGWIDMLFSTGPRFSMFDLWTALRKAGVDPRIEAVVLRIGPLTCDWGKINELRDLLLDYRRSGGKAYAYIEEALDFDKEYFLATACDRIFLHPEGSLIVNGIGGPVPFFKQALEKLGVEIEVEHWEEYKTAYHMFLHDHLTPAHREMLESIYGGLFDRYAEGVAEARGISPDEFRALVNRGFLSGEEAETAKLVDGRLYEDQLQQVLRENHPRAKPVTLSRYLRVPVSRLGLNRGRKIALIYGSGPIITGEGYDSYMGSRTFVRFLREARQDPAIAAIVFRVDSPGGSVVASDDIWREVCLAKREKPVVVSMSDMAGSGGYQVAMAAHKIVAQPQTLTGSIGVIFAKFNFRDLYRKLGVTSDPVRFGQRADMLSSFRASTPDERDLLRGQIRSAYHRFVAKAAENRLLDESEVLESAKGRVWTGEQALERGLIDELGGLSRALEIAKQLAGIPEGSPVRLVLKPKPASLWNAFFTPRLPQIKADLPPGLTRVIHVLRILGPQQPWALMPFWLPTD
jgi:protease-4